MRKKKKVSFFVLLLLTFSRFAFETWWVPFHTVTWNTRYKALKMCIYKTKCSVFSFACVWHEVVLTSNESVSFPQFKHCPGGILVQIIRAWSPVWVWSPVWLRIEQMWSPVWCELVWPSGKVLSFLFKSCGLWTLSCDFVPHNYETWKLWNMQMSFWWWQCSDRYIISLPPPSIPLSPHP